MPSSTKKTDPISRVFESLCKGSTLILLYLVIAIIFLFLHVCCFKWSLVSFDLKNHTFSHPPGDLNTWLLLGFLVWGVLIYLGPTSEQKHAEENEIQNRVFGKRLWHRIRVTYFLEIICMYLGICLLFERVFLEQIGWAKPFLDTVQEAGVALIIAAILSAIYEVQHREGTFGKPVRRIEALTRKLDLQVEEANRISGYLNYRKEIQEAYGAAKKRIISISDYWIVDREWWSDGDWAKCPLYDNLHKCYAGFKDSADKYAMRVVFAGNVPWPQTDTGKFTTPDFERFIGVVWRLVIADKLRAAFALNKMDTIRVVVATVPVPATIVDNEVFIFLQGIPREDADTEPISSENEDGPPNPLEGARGTKIAGGIDNTTAEAYEAMIYGYLRHVRSAREYVETVLYYAALNTMLLGDGLVEEMADQTHQPGQTETDKDSHRGINEDNLVACLESLGMKDWMDWKHKKDCVDKTYCRERAISALTLFCVKGTVPVKQFEDLRKDLL